MKPYPKDQLCPRCNKFLANIFKYPKDGEDKQEEKPEPKQFETKTATVSSKLKGKVRVKKKVKEINFTDDKIELKGKEEYIKLLGITTIERTQLFSSNQKYVYLLELTNNLDFIATSILGGVLDKMLLSISDDENEKCQFFIKDKIIYLAYGTFPDKKGKWLLEQMAKQFSEMIRGKDVNNLEKMDKYNIETKFSGRLKFILKEYIQLQEVFSDQEIPYIEDEIRIDYVGLSSRSIGVVSLLLGDELIIDMPIQFENREEEIEMKESILTAKIEAIAANTFANTGAVPRWIAVKLGFQQYKFLTIQKYKNSYYISMLSEGNLGKIEMVESILKPYVDHVTSETFTGNLRPYNRLKTSLKELLKKKRIFS